MRDLPAEQVDSSPRHAAPSDHATPGWKNVMGAAIVIVSLATSLASSNGLEYTVAPGDALWTIASAHDVAIDDLVETNGLADPDLIIVGATLTIPVTAADALTSPTGVTTHTVEPGDSLWAIAALHRVPLGALARQNDIGADALIFPGQTLQLPVDGTDPLVDTTSTATDGGAEQTSAPTTSSNRVTSHTVQAGDSIWSIATRYGVDMATLFDTNQLASDSILQIGQVLRLPAVSVTGLGDLSNLPLELQSAPERLTLMPVFDHWADEYGIPADLLKALTWFESGWNNEKTSSASAIGIGQVLPITATFVSDVLLSGTDLDPYVPEENIQLSARYLRYLLDNAGSVRLAVASYYQGLTATRQHGVYRSSEFYVDGILSLRSRFA